MKYYISGKITGLTRNEYERNFNEAEEYLTIRGHEVINPTKILKDMPKSTTYDEYMKVCMVLLEMCDGIYLLRNWKGSKGASMEKEHAREYGIRVFYKIREVKNMCKYCDREYGDFFYKEKFLKLAKGVQNEGCAKDVEITLMIGDGNELNVTMFMLDGAIGKKKKINYCPMCGRKLNVVSAKENET